MNKQKKRIMALRAIYEGIIDEDEQLSELALP